MRNFGKGRYLRSLLTKKQRWEIEKAKLDIKYKLKREKKNNR